MSVPSYLVPNPLLERFVNAHELIGIGLIKDAAGISEMSGKAIQQIVRAGLGPKYFGIGEQLVVTWNDGTNDYDMPFDVVHHGNVVNGVGDTVPGMYLQSHYALPGVQFDGNEAFYSASDAALPSGTYYFTMGNAWGSNVVKDKIYEFTTTQAVPKGGLLVLGTASSRTSGLPDISPTNWRVRTYATQKDTNTIEILTLSDVESSEGTDLGTLSSTTLYGTTGLNNMQRSGYGYNRWAQSGIRQWLNSDKAVNTWWEPQNVYDCPPDQISTMRGFMAGLPAEFLEIVQPIRVTTALNTVSDSGIGTTENTIDRFFLASLQQEFIAPQLADAEGETWDYWKQRLGGVQHAQGTVRPEHIRYAIDNHTSAQTCRMRSAYRGTAYSAWYVTTSGTAYGSTYATYAHRPCPACVIC